MVDMGKFTLYEGRMPLRDNEIALELSQLSYLASDLKVGDTIPVELIIPVIDREEYDAYEDLIIELVPEFEKRYGLENLLYEINNYNTDFMDYYNKSLRGDLSKLDKEPLNWIFLLRHGFVDTNGKNEHSLESFGGTRVVVKTSELYMSVAKEVSEYDKIFLKDFFSYKAPDPLDLGEKVENKEKYTRVNQYVHLTREMLVTGIIEDYSGTWDVGNEPLVNAFISEEGGRAFIEDALLLSENVDLSNFKTRENIFVGSNVPIKELFDKHMDKFDSLIINESAYPDREGTTEYGLTYGILGGIFLATILGVFQIYLTQTKRRTRRLALLKSIGATNKQIRKLLLWEVFYLLLFTLPLGTGLGLMISKLSLTFMNKYRKAALIMHIDYKLTLIGLGLGILSIFIGILLPMVLSIKVPLVGSISPPTRKGLQILGKTKDKKANLNMRVQSFSLISFKNIIYNRGKTMITGGIYGITSLILLGSILLSYIFFGQYIDQVLIKDKPDYIVYYNHGLTKDEMEEVNEALDGMEGLGRKDLYKRGEHAYLWHEKIGENQMYKEFLEILPTYLAKDHFGKNNGKFVNLNEDNRYLVEEAIVANIYGLDPDQDLYKRFEDSLSLGKINRESFEKGEEVILLLPIYKEGDKKDRSPQDIREVASGSSQEDRMERLLSYSGSYDISYDFRLANEYKEDQSLKPGDIVHLTIPTEDMVGMFYTNDVRFLQVKVGGIIHFFPGKSIWPFGQTIENPTIIGSHTLLGKTHPSTSIGRGYMSVESIESLRKWLKTTRYGETYANIYQGKDIDEVDLDINLKRFARENQAKLKNLKEENKKIFAKAINMAAIVLILGLSLSILSLIILYNTILSKLEQERERIGIFQALGVTKFQFNKVYIFLGLGYGVLALVLSHIVLGLVLTLSHIGGRPFSFYLYPWNIHIIACLGIIILTSLTYYLPLRKIIGNQPIDNIRNLGR